MALSFDERGFLSEITKCDLTVTTIEPCLEIQRLKARELDTPERQFLDFGALRTPFDLSWDCTLGVAALTADRELCTRFGVKNGDQVPGKTGKKLVIGLIPVCRQSA